MNLVKTYITEYKKYDQPQNSTQEYDFWNKFIAKILGRRICYVECLLQRNRTIHQYRAYEGNVTYTQALYNFLNPDNMKKYFDLNKLFMPVSQKYDYHIIDPNIDYMVSQTEEILIKEGYQLYTIQDAYALIDQYIKQRDDLPTFEEHFQIIMCTKGVCGPYSHWRLGWIYFRSFRPVLNIDYENLVPKIYIKKIK